MNKNQVRIRREAFANNGVTHSVRYDYSRITASNGNKPSEACFTQRHIHIGPKTAPRLSHKAKVGQPPKY